MSQQLLRALCLWSQAALRSFSSGLSSIPWLDQKQTLRLVDFPELPGLDECISLSRLHSKTHNLGYRKPQTYFFTILEKSGEGSPFGLLMDSHLFDMYSCELSSVGVVSGGWGIGERQRKGKREREREKVRVLWCLFLKVPTLRTLFNLTINTFLEASFLNIATQEVRASTYRFWGLNKSSL